MNPDNRPNPSEIFKRMAHIRDTEGEAHVSVTRGDTFSEDRVEGLDGEWIEGECPVHGHYQGEAFVELDEASARDITSDEARYGVQLTDDANGKQWWLTEMGLREIEVDD